MLEPRRGRNPESHVLRLTARLLPLVLLGAAVAGAQTPPEAPPTPPAPAPTPTPAPTPSPEALPFKITGLVYGDYYDVLRSHREGLQDQNGFWFRRIYVAYEQPLSKTLEMRVRFETNSKGDFKSTGVMNAYLKDAWIRWSSDGHAVFLGMVPTPNIEFMDALQGYRSIERSPVDLYKWDSSRDVGLSVQGSFGRGRRTRYAFEVGNGAGTGSETDKSKTVRGQLSRSFEGGFVVEGYADRQDRPGGKGWSTLEATAGWHRDRWRASVQYGRQQRRHAETDGSDAVLQFLSGFVAVPIASRLTLVLRGDRAFEPVAGGEGLDYFPLADRSPLVFGYAALDLSLWKAVHLIPNVEVARYDTPADGPRPGTDVMPRLTFFYSW